MGPQAPKDPNLVAQGLPQTPTWSPREPQGPQLGGARPLKTMLGPTRGSKLPKIELSLLNCSWARFWALRGASQDTLGSLLAPLGALLGALGTLLGLSWDALGRSWGALGALWAVSWRPWAPGRVPRPCQEPLWNDFVNRSGDDCVSFEVVLGMAIGLKLFKFLARRNARSV